MWYLPPSDIPLCPLHPSFQMEKSRHWRRIFSPSHWVAETGWEYKLPMTSCSFLASSWETSGTCVTPFSYCTFQTVNNGWPPRRGLYRNMDSGCVVWFLFHTHLQGSSTKTFPVRILERDPSIFFILSAFMFCVLSRDSCYWNFCF